MVEQLQSRLAKNWIKAIYSGHQKNIFCFSHLFGSEKSPEKSSLPNSFTINIPQVTEEILSPTIFVTKWIFMGYCKTSAFFSLIFPSLTTMKFPYSSLMNTTSLGEYFKFPMSSITIQFSSSPAITFFSEDCFFFTKPYYF